MRGGRRGEGGRGVSELRAMERGVGAPQVMGDMEKAVGVWYMSKCYILSLQQRHAERTSRWRACGRPPLPPSPV